LSALASLSCSNVFTELAVKDTDRAKLFAANQYVDESNWTQAIATIGTMTAEMQASRDVQVLLASAYAGRCGVDSLSILDHMTNLGSDLLFGALMSVMANSSQSTLADCIQAETILKAIGDESARTVNENLLMAILELGKIGAVLNIKGDIDGDNQYTSSGDSSFDPCTDASLPPSDTATDKASADEIVYSLAVASLSLTAAGGSIGGDSATAIAALCTAGIPCSSLTQPSDVQSAHRTLIRGAIRENQNVGLKICSGNAVLCACGT
jgi:hypothetical protein